MESTIIKNGFDLLKREKRYDQLTVVNKLKYLDVSVAPATFGKILKNIKISDKLLGLVSSGIQLLIRNELDFEWQGTAYVKLNTPNWEPIEVRKVTTKELSIVLNPGFTFHTEGRLEIHQKVEFFSTAQKEVVEFGVRLNTFSSYFKSRKDSEFKTPIEALMKRGVKIKCYMLDPECNEASVYFEDRRRVQEDEIKNTDTMRDALRNLSLIKKEMNELAGADMFEIFTYKHIPYNYFMIVDGGTPNGKMMLSHYVYGLPRGKCPVLEFTKSGNHELYMKYWGSFQKLVKDAKAIPGDNKT